MYDDLNALDEFHSELKVKGFGDGVASMIAHPASVNLKKEMAKLKGLADPKGLSKIIPAGAAKSILKADTDKISREKAPLIAAAIGPLDTIEGAALAFNDLGFDESLIYDALDQMVQDGEFTPNSWQQRELTRRLPVESTITDLFYAAVPGVARGKFGLWETFLRIKGKR